MHRILVLIFSLAVLSACNKKPQSVEQVISKKWAYVSIVDSTGENIKAVADGDFFSFFHSKQKTFSYSLSKENIDASGLWTITDRVLQLTYDLTPANYEADSTTYEVVGKEAQIIYFSEGKEIARVTDSGVSSPRTVRSYHIDNITDDELVLSENGVTYNFKSNTDALYTGGITFTKIWRGLLGIATLLGIGFLFSSNRKAISWKLVFTGLTLQLIFAIGVLKVPAVAMIFDALSRFFVVILSFTQEGSQFLFGNLVSNSDTIGFIFVFQILPTIIFFSALTSVLFYLGFLQKIVYGFAWIMSKTMNLSGSESLAAAGNIFLGQTESPLLIKPYIEKMNRSELLCLMVGGMATIAGGVLAAYIGFLGGDDPIRRLFFAKHLLAASVMSAPAAIVAAKMLIPQTEKIESRIELSKDKIGKNVLEAISNGTIDGLRLAVNVGAMLLVFIALLALVNYLLNDLLGDMTGLNAHIAALTNNQYSGLTLQFMLGYLFAPLSWLLGVNAADMALVGQLLGEKTILNEFVAYVTLGKMEFAGAFKEERSIIIATYILCGFANFASIGIQIGGIGALAPGKRTELSELGIKALIGGTLASLYTAVLVGMLI